MNWVNQRVKVRPNKADGSPHPHAGKTGVVTEVLSLFSAPRAVIRIDEGFESAGNYMVVTLGCLDIVED